MSTSWVKSSRNSLISKVFLALFVTLLFASPGLLASPAYAENVEKSIEYAGRLSTAFENAAEIITPSVVNISASVKIRRNTSTSPGVPDPFREFFGEDFFERFNIPRVPEGGQMQQGMGTGVIVNENGYILTNNHVVGEADKVEVRLHNKQTYEAEVVGTDPKTDIAVIRIDAPDLKPAQLGDSDRLKIGEWVVAAGNPFGLDNTITAGIVSAKGRSIMGGSSYEDFIQTDAAINPGNSGGPLVNLRGEVIGINTAIFSRSGGYMGIGFAIPISMAKDVMNSLIKEGRVVRGWLGVGIQNLTKELAKSFNVADTKGALVGHVEPDGPADKAGIRQGDIIVEFANEEVKDINQLRNAVAAVKPGTSSAVVVIRDGRKKSLRVKLGELDAATPEKKPDVQESAAEDLGVRIEPLTRDLARRLGSERTSGVVVTSVRPGSPAALSGIQPRDILLEGNGKEINSLDDVEKVLSKDALEDGVRLVVESRGMQRFVFLQLKE